MMYMDGGSSVTVGAEKRTVSTLQTVIFTDVQSLAFASCLFFPPLSLILFSAFHFFTQGENEEEQKPTYEN